MGRGDIEQIEHEKEETLRVCAGGSFGVLSERKNRRTGSVPVTMKGLTMIIRLNQKDPM